VRHYKVNTTTINNSSFTNSLSLVPIVKTITHGELNSFIYNISDTIIITYDVSSKQETILNENPIIVLNIKGSLYFNNSNFLEANRSKLK
jgi:hypothetical protein